MSGISARLAAASGAFSTVAIIAGAAVFGSATVPLARLGYLLVVLGVIAFVVFVGYLHRVLRLAEGPGGWLATVALGAGLLHSAVRFEAQLPRMMDSYRGDSLSPEIAQTLEDLNGMGFLVSGMLLGLYAAAAGGVLVAHRVLPAWLGWFGVVTGGLAAIAGVVGMVDPDSYFPLAYVAALVWILAVSITLTVRPQRPGADSALPAPAAMTNAPGAV